MSGQYRHILVLPNIKIHNANALSSPFTIGFPAMTAWLGVTHALQRRLNQAGNDVVFSATGVVSHDMNLQTYRGDNDYVSSIVGAAHPLNKMGARSPFIEEARCHLKVSILIEVQGVSYQQQESFIEQVAHLLTAKLKIAGGDIQHFDNPKFFMIEDGNADDPRLKCLIRKLMPGFVLVERRDLLVDAMEQGQDALGALIDYLAIHHYCTEEDDGNVVWESKRKPKYDKRKETFVPAGWLVPIATGFQAISELGEAKNQRDPTVPHCFAESIVTLGEFKMPYRFSSVSDMLWCYHYDKANQLYQCIQLSNYQRINKITEDEFA